MTSNCPAMGVGPAFELPRSWPGARAGGIVGGRDVSGRKSPWQVSLRFYDQSSRQWEHVCGGSLVHPQWLLTAAHCMEPEDLEACAFRVQGLRQEDVLGDRLGDVVDDSEGQGPRAGQDEVFTEMGDSSGLGVPPLRRKAQEPPGQPHGLTQFLHAAPLPPAHPLQEVDVPVVGAEDCRRLCDKIGRAVRDDVCMPSVTLGPLVCRWSCPWLQVGAVSWEHFCTHQGLPGVHTRVTSCVSWVPTPALS
ncbi:mastin-like [Dasypus novemcinctus]|uniref:mastin-like n=1 Tax=Dasypus novemcinctus TaxID=9361 RepID=UPI00265F1487|nr:mastin-like [Dasypus novemcinctus]